MASRRPEPDSEVLERAIAAMNERLDGLFPSDTPPCKPIVLIVGHQRSGTTLVYQTLSALGEVGYPSNLVARFWRAPVAGIRVQQSVQAHIAAAPSAYVSELGSTQTLLEPHEFSYFWNHWWPQPRRCLDPSRFVNTLGGMERAYGAPVVMKNVFNTLRVDTLADLLPTARFVVLRRNLRDVACSTLNARRQRFGTDDAWFGVAPEQHQSLRALPPAAQIAGQLHSTELALQRARRHVSADRIIDLPYVDFCRDPVSILHRLREQIEPRTHRAIPSGFAPTEHATHPDAAALLDALAEHFTSEQIEAGGLS